MPLLPASPPAWCTPYKHIASRLHLQVSAADCAALSERELAPLAMLPVESLSLARCWTFEV